MLTYLHTYICFMSYLATISSETQSRCSADDELGCSPDASSHGKPADRIAASSGTETNASVWRRPMSGQKVSRNRCLCSSFSQLNKCTRLGMSQTGIWKVSAQAERKDLTTWIAQSVPEQKVPTFRRSCVSGSSLTMAEVRHTAKTHCCTLYMLLY